MDRRRFLQSSAAAAMVAAHAPLAALAPASAGDAALDTLFDVILADALDHSPELATAIGVDKGARAAAKSRLNDRSTEAMKAALARTQRSRRALEATPAADLSPANRLNRRIVGYQLDQQAEAPQRFGIDSVVRPYRIFQQGGAYYDVPDFLNDTHVVTSVADAEAYCARLEGLASALDQDTAVQRERAPRGYVAPDFALDLTLGQMRRLRAGPPADSNLVRSLVNRAKAADITGDWGKRASAIVADKVRPALDRQIALISDLRRQTAPGAGVWRIRDGGELYAAALAQATTTRLTPAEVHAMGLSQVAEIGDQLNHILSDQGFTRGTVGERLTALNRNPDELYADSADGRAALIASLNTGIRGMQARLPRAFAELPRAALEIRAVPADIQDGAANGYYKRATLDGSRPAIYFINLKDVGDWPKYGLPSLTYHEGVPGHHLQIGIAQQSATIPTLRKISFYSAYSEGWALYAEQLADELGGYATPLERAGYLQSFLFRAARLVVDTGIHTQRWTREQATRYLVDTTGFAAPRAQREVERYCTQPGQACSYKVGHMAWTRARTAARAALGDRFDLTWFHEVLKDGAMPLTILEEVVSERTKARLA